MIYDMTPVQWLKHVIFHPFEGYEDLRWKKQGSMKISMIIVFFLFCSQVFSTRYGGFAFNMRAYSDIFNVVPILVQSVVYYATWVVANWAWCTLLDGEGNMRRIAIYSAYALVPYVIGNFLSTLISYFVTLDESIWTSSVYLIGLWWSVILMVFGMKACHQYSFTKTVICLLLTIVGMLLILCLVVLVMSLFQQVWLFIITIYTEIMYRVRS